MTLGDVGIHAATMRIQLLRQLPSLARHAPSVPRITAARVKSLLDPPFRREAWFEATAPQLHLRIGNDPPAVDRIQALAALEQFLGRVEGFGRRYSDVWQRRETIYAETDLQFRDAAGAVQVIPCSIVVRALRGRIQDIRFHLDPSPIPSGFWLN